MSTSESASTEAESTIPDAVNPLSVVRARPPIGEPGGEDTPPGDRPSLVPAGGARRARSAAASASPIRREALGHAPADAVRARQASFPSGGCRRQLLPGELVPRRRVGAVELHVRAGVAPGGADALAGKEDRRAHRQHGQQRAVRPGRCPPSSASPTSTPIRGIRPLPRTSRRRNRNPRLRTRARHSTTQAADAKAAAAAGAAGASIDGLGTDRRPFEINGL